MGLINSADYQDVLGHRLVPHVQRFPGVSFIFQQENATIHTWLQDNSVDTMDWPSRSPDLNPIESLSNSHRQGPPSAICKEWSEVDESVIKNLVNSMPERIFQVINRSRSCTDN
uniref:DDE_3 domain-containing protein n=1 Tax=Heterorhabditis bacteriophora TaxID=37862 RepID=A0A1I7WM23_HETBA